MSSTPLGRSTIEDKAFLLLLALLSAAFAWVLGPFFGAVLWAVILAIIFMPLYRRIRRSVGERGTLAALLTLLIILVLVILPLTVIVALLIQEGSGVYDRVQSGEFDVGQYFQRLFDALPPWATSLLDRFGLNDLGQIQARVSAGLAKSSQFLATQVLNVGRNTLDFVIGLGVMLYVLFFLLRDGEAIFGRIRKATPLPPGHQQTLFRQLGSVIRATVKGNLVVAVIQGALGGLIFWVLGVHAVVLWAALMAVLSLLPAVGTALVWMPVAIYFLATGSIWKGIVLIAYGVLVIGLVDNVLRPILVGKETEMPDYIVLVSTLGGLALFGINGFVLGPVIAAMFMTGWSLYAAHAPR